MDETMKSGAPSQKVVPTSLIKPQTRKPYDPDVTFEEYHCCAKKTREEELSLEGPVLNVRELFHKKDHGAHSEGPAVHLTEDDFKNPERRLEVSDEEWMNASRAVRSASWGACEYPVRDQYRV